MWGALQRTRVKTSVSQVSVLIFPLLCAKGMRKYVFLWKTLQGLLGRAAELS